MEIVTQSLLGKLLAGENLRIEVSCHTDTAYIDLEKRLIVIPDWDVSDSLSILFLGHEVSHALFTPPDVWVKKAKEMGKCYQNIMNIVEDYRIEKLIMNKYPGLKSHFHKGYQELYDKKFFGIINQNSNPMTKINAKLKLFETALIDNIDYFMNSDTEKDYQYIIDNVNLYDFNSVISVTDYLFKKHSKSVKVIKLGSIVIFTSDDKDDEKNILDGVIDEQIKKFINNAADELFKKKNNEENKVLNDLTFTFDLRLKDYKIKTKFNKTTYPYKNEVKNMVVLFENLKNAKNYKSTNRIKTGKIDLKKIHQYKYETNIFIRKKISKKQKNHMLYLLVDMSGSMDKYSFELEKIKNDFICFAQKTGIDIYVSGFTETSYISCNNIYINRIMDIKYKNISTNRGNGTPLSSALLLSLLDIQKNMKNSDTKVTFILLSDGYGNSNIDRYKYISYNNTLVNRSKNNTLENQIFKIFKSEIKDISTIVYYFSYDDHSIEADNIDYFVNKNYSKLDNKIIKEIVELIA